MPGLSHEDILHRIIDGEARPEEVASLTEILERDPALRRLYDRLVALTAALREVGSVEAPPQLRAEVLAAIPGRPQPTRERASWLHSVRAGLQRRLVAREALVFAGGMLVGALVLLGIRGDGASLSRENLTGTMLGQSAQEGQRLLQTTPIGLEGVAGEVQTFAVTGGVLAQVDLRSTREVVVVVGFAARSFEPVAVSQSQPAPRGVEIHPDRVLLRHVGENRYQLLLRGDTTTAGPLRMEISSQGDWQEHTLATREGGR